MKRMILLVALIALTTDMATGAIEQLSESRGQIKKLSDLKLDPTAFPLKCGEYFRFTGEPGNVTKPGAVVLIYDTDPSIDRVSPRIIIAVDQYKITVRVIDDPTPMAVILRTADPFSMLKQITVEMSPEDFKKAWCLEKSPRTK